jgi:hypothetical protein
MSRTIRADVSPETNLVDVLNELNVTLAVFPAPKTNGLVAVTSSYQFAKELNLFEKVILFSEKSVSVRVNYGHSIVRSVKSDGNMNFGPTLNR